MFDISDKEYELLADYILKNFGIQLGKGKKTLLINRLSKVLDQGGYKNFLEYYNYVASDTTGVAMTTLVEKITTNHTFFMREPDHFYYLRDNILPGLARTVRNRDLCIWSAGCSTGEEPYTLAMIMQDYFGVSKPLWDTKILATDIFESSA